MKPEDLSFCGIMCSNCDVYKATVCGDEEARTRAHRLWTKTAQEHWGMEELDPAILSCRGCRREGENIFKGCRHCPIHRCAREKSLVSCGQCPEWRECELLSPVFADEPQAKRNLEELAGRSDR